MNLLKDLQTCVDKQEDLDEALRNVNNPIQQVLQALGYKHASAQCVVSVTIPRRAHDSYVFINTQDCRDNEPYNFQILKSILESTDPVWAAREFYSHTEPTRRAAEKAGLERQLKELQDKLDRLKE